MKNRIENETIENVGFKQIRDVKPSRTTYSNVEIYMATEQKKGRDLRISEAAVELIEEGLKAKGIF
jgi:hypothetical protein